MLKYVKRLLGLERRELYRSLQQNTAGRLLLMKSAVASMNDCLAPAITARHEGITYLYGHTDGEMTLVVGAMRPEARTTHGSFAVSAVAMARVVRRISDAGLQLVGQAHTHPGAAYHSEGDETGTRIAYQGFVSIVFPDYGVRLPSLEGAAVYLFRNGNFRNLDPEAVSIIPSCLT